MFSIADHRLLIFSLPDDRILSTAVCSHHQITEFSLPRDILTTRSPNSHYPDYRRLFSPPGHRILTTAGYSHYQITEFSLPQAVHTTSLPNSHYCGLSGDVLLLGFAGSPTFIMGMTGGLRPSVRTGRELASLPRCIPYQSGIGDWPGIQMAVQSAVAGSSHSQIVEFSLPRDVLTTRSPNSHYHRLFSLPDH